MTRNSARWTAVLGCAAMCGSLFGAEEMAWEVCCAKHRYLAKAWEAEGGTKGSGDLKFAPDRIIDVAHVKIDITPDFGRRTLQGVAEVTFSPIAESVRSISLDAVDLEVGSVGGTVEVSEFSVGKETLDVVFKRAVAAGEKVTVKVAYSAAPENGMFFRTPAMGYPEGDTQMWTQGEPERHRHWFPSYDYPNERFTTEVICRVPEGMVAVSNGRMVGGPKKDPVTGLVAHHWLQDKEHVNYLVTVVAGYFEKVEGKHGELPIAIYVPPSEKAQAANSFRDTEKILAFFEKEIGVPYPWDKYFNMCVHDFIAGGMENTSATTLTVRTLFTDDTEEIYTSRRLDAHEIAHQWFGDLVTCKDWSHLWLNEGFATYYTQLYEEEKFGVDELRYGMMKNAERVLSQKEDERPIQWREYKSPREQFDYRAYPKGAWILHMLRSQLGPELFRECIRTYLEENGYRTVVTEDLNRVIEKVTGRSMDRFFEQWVRLGGVPRLSVKYGWDGERKEVKLTVKQTHKVNGEVPVFHFPLPVRFHGKDGQADRVLEITKAEEEFYIKPGEAPRLVRIDPEYTVLAEIAFDPPKPMLDVQLELDGDMMGRLLAVRKLAGKEDLASVGKLAKRLREDPYYGVRIEASKALEKTRTEEALKALLDPGEQKDARVRQQVVKTLGRFYREEAAERLKAILASEKNPAVAADAIAALGRFPGKEIGEIIVRQLGRDSYRNRIAGAAIEALRVRGDASVVGMLVGYLGENSAKFEGRDLGKAMRAVGLLGRHGGGAEKGKVREFLVGRLEDPRRGVRVSAIQALGELGDPRALGPVETFLSNEENEEGKAAKEAVVKLAGDKPAPQELKDLRGEVLRLQEEMRKLGEELERVKKRAGAAEVEK